MLDFQKLSAQYQQTLLRQVVPFWLNHGRDGQCGGYFDLLSATGEVIEGDKFVIQQAHQVWAFAWLYNTLDGQPAWLEHARHGAAFLSQFAHTNTIACYAQLDRRGRPVLPATDILPSCSVAMAYAQLHRATADDEWAMVAKQVASNLFQRREVTRSEQAVTIGGFRQVRHLSETVALLKMLLDMQSLLDEESWKQQVDSVVQEVLHEFVDRRTDILRESILPEGSFINTPEGRRINVGLIFQTANYLLDFYAENGQHKAGTTGNRKLVMQVVGWCLRLCEQAWDEVSGGLNQYVDLKQQPLTYPDWQQKWAWVQTESLSALLKGYLYTRQSDCQKWFKRIHDYTFHHFPDTAHIGWHVAINAQGQPLLSTKAIPLVGCFSLIRCLAETAQLLTKCDQIQAREQSDRSVH